VPLFCAALARAGAKGTKVSRARMVRIGIRIGTLTFFISNHTSLNSKQLGSILDSSFYNYIKLGGK
jgi:hypothetical protein